MERHLLTRVLRHTGGNRVQAAKILGIHRATLYRLIEGEKAELDLEDEAEA
jgi:DNA-binding protein Fis